MIFHTLCIIGLKGCTLYNLLKHIIKSHINLLSHIFIATFHTELPDTILQYTDITPMESTFEIRKSKTYNRPSICYKAFNTGTDQFVLFRRFPGLVLQSVKDHQLVDRYRKIKHPGLISVNHVFVTEAFGDNCK